MPLSDWRAKAKLPLRRRLNSAVTPEIQRAVTSSQREHGARLSAAEEQLIAVQKRLDEAEQQLAKLEKQSTAFIGAIDTAQFLIGAAAPQNRIFARGARERLLKETASLTGERPDLGPLLHQTYQSVFDLETRSIGRIAGSTVNVVGKLLTTTLLAQPDGPVLEIGTLFGIFGAGLQRQYRRLGFTRSLVVVDPLEGMQVQPNTSTLHNSDASGSPVIRDVVEHNFHLAGAAPGSYTIVHGYSTDPAVQAEVGSQKYAAIIVDGDHSEEGVYKDLHWVETIALDGAVVVIDDYGDDRWKGVERAVTRYLADDTRMHMLGRVSTSAYLRFGDEPAPFAASD